MIITNRAKEAILSRLQDDSSLLPGITWVCDDGYTDPLVDGYFGFGFCERNETFKDHLASINGITFVIDIPELFKKQLKTSKLDFIESKFIVKLKFH